MGREMNREELAWAAGFFDGEGHAGTIMRKSSVRRLPKFYLNVSQAEVTTLYRFFDAVGGVGSIHYNRREGAAVKATPMYAWQAQSFEVAQAVVAMLWCFLSGPKRAQITEALQRYTALRATLEVRAWRRRVL